MKPSLLGVLGLVLAFVAVSYGSFAGVGEVDPRVQMEFERPIPIPEDWVLKGAPLTDRKLSFLIALKVRNADKLADIVLEVSTPSSPKYGKHLTREQVAELISPPKEDVGTVRDWLLANGVDEADIEVLPRGDWIRFKATVKTAENLLGCSFRVYQHKTGTRLIRTRFYSVPLSISKLIDFVGGTIRFPKIKTLRPASATAKLIGDALVNPQFIKNHYNITDQGVSSSNLQSVNQFLGQYYSPSDLSDFFKKFNLPNNPVAKVVGTNHANNPGTEASLDIQYIMAVATNVPTWFVYTSGNDNGNQEPFLEWITALANTPNAPWVNSVSYGDLESSISGSYLSRTDIEFMAVGAQGLSILYASGDDGVGCKRCNSFIPDWPASSPWVTTVGGTEMNGNTEVAVGFSGGGFSNYFGRPSYQDAAVQNYLNTANLPASKFFNVSSRAYPDIAAFATNFEVVVGGGVEPVDGTSCAAPTASGVISLLNDIRLQNGKSALGFLNPFLYSITTPGALNDITSGNNGAGCCPGFDAASGWDPVTGLGSPNYGILKGVVLELP